MTVVAKLPGSEAAMTTGVLSSAAMISDALSIEFADGAVKAVAGENASTIASPAKKRSAQKLAPEKGNQGSLF
jgi:hypothetical protein